LHLFIPFCLYLGATVLYLRDLSSGSRNKGSDLLLRAAFWTHLGILLSVAYSQRRIPLLEIREGLSVLSLVCVGLFLSLRRRVTLEGFGAPLSLFATVLLGISFSFPSRIGSLPELLDTLWFPLHTVTSFLGIGAFALAFCAGLLYLIQERMIKAKRLGRPVKFLPSLDSLDRVVHHSLLLGFPLLSVGLLTGYLWARTTLRGMLWEDPKVLLAALTWFTYAVVFYWRFRAGWKGRKVALLAALGFVFVMFTYLGVNLFLGGHHSALTGILR